MSISIPRESDEFIAITITPVGGETPVTAGVTITTTTGNERPSEWRAPTVVGDEIGLLTGALERGRHSVWARVVSSPETIVLEVDTITIT